MKMIRQSSLQYLLSALLLMALTGCGASNTAITADNGAPGSITAKMAWGEDAGKTTAKTVASVPAGVVKVQFTVTGSGPKGALPVVRSSIDVTGSTAEGSISGVYPGQVTVAVKALDGAGATLYEGFARNAVVAAGATTDVGTIAMTPPLTKEQDAGCVACHETTLEITGQNLVANFKQSGHYSNDNWTLNAKLGVTGAGCAGCHGPNHNDPAPAASGRCFECHGALGYKHQNTTALVAGDANAARYLNAGNNNCSSCHEPHNPLRGVGQQERKDWAESKHGDVYGLAWAHYDFTVRNTCSACHTSSGFIKALGNGWTDTTAASTTVSSGKQPLTCDACHSSNDFKNSLRKLSGGYKAGMGGYGPAVPANIQYPNVNESNICIPCHASRENGASINASTANFGNTGFKNPHYLAAGAVFYGTGGFQFYTSAVRYNTYGAAGKVGRAANWSHGRIGMDNYTAGALTTGANVGTNKDNAGKIRGTGNKGQCVACHLGPANTHSFDAFEVAKATWAGNTTNAMGCFGCHSGEDMEEVAHEERGLVERSLDFLLYQLEQYGLYYYDTANPYFFKAPYVVGGANVSATNWTADPYSVGATGKQTMGAAMNAKLLKAEKGSHVHNRAFMRALITDSLVYLQKGPAGIAADRKITSADPNDLINFSNYSTAISAPNADRLAGKVGHEVSISGIKGYLIRNNARR